MNDGDLVKELKKAQDEKMHIALKVGAGKDDNFAQIKNSQKRVARINSILREKQIGALNG